MRTQHSIGIFFSECTLTFLFFSRKSLVTFCAESGFLYMLTLRKETNGFSQQSHDLPQRPPGPEIYRIHPSLRDIKQ